MYLDLGFQPGKLIYQTRLSIPAQVLGEEGGEYSRNKTYKDVPLNESLFSQEIPKHGFVMWTPENCEKWAYILRKTCVPYFCQNDPYTWVRVLRLERETSVQSNLTTPTPGAQVKKQDET